LVVLGVLAVLACCPWRSITWPASRRQTIRRAWRGAVGALIGGSSVCFFNLPGIILGPFLGALLFE